MTPGVDRAAPTLDALSSSRPHGRLTLGRTYVCIPDVLTRPKALRPALLARRSHRVDLLAQRENSGQFPLWFVKARSERTSHPEIRPLIPGVARAVRSVGMLESGAVGELSLRVACRQLGITIKAADFDCIQGMAQAGRTIFVASTIRSSTQWRWVVAHELGHILVQRGQLPHCHEFEEWTADWFARELLAPVAELATLSSTLGRGCCGSL